MHSLDDEVELGADQHDNPQEGGGGAMHDGGEGMLRGHHHSAVPVADGGHEALRGAKENR